MIRTRVCCLDDERAGRLNVPIFVKSLGRYIRDESEGRVPRDWEEKPRA